MPLQSDPLRLPKQELMAAWNAVHRMRKATTLEEIETDYRSVLNHLEKLWVKTERICVRFGARFDQWQSSYRTLRKEDQLLCYFIQSRNADNHSAQEIAYLVVGYLQVSPGPAFLFTDHARPSVDTIANRGVSYPPPKMHLGEALGTKDPRELCVYACNFYADYLARVNAEFFSG